MTTLADVVARGYEPLLVTSALPDKDARTYALARLREFISLLTFSRTMARNEAARHFRLHRTSIHPYQPDSPTDLNLPAVAFIPGSGSTQNTDLGPLEVAAGSEGKLGPGTALLRLGEYVETFTIEVIAGKQATRRAIVGGLRVALQDPLRLSLPDYFDATAIFELGESRLIDEAQASLNRRRAQLTVTLRVAELAPVRLARFRPEVLTEVVPAVEVEVAAVVVPEPTPEPGERVFDDTFDSTFA